MTFSALTLQSPIKSLFSLPYSRPHRVKSHVRRARNGVVVRALAPPTNVARVQIPALTPFAIWLSLLLVLSFAPIGFGPGIPVSTSLEKPTFSNSNSTRNQVDEEPLCGCAASKSSSSSSSYHHHHIIIIIIIIIVIIIIIIIIIIKSYPLTKPQFTKSYKLYI